MQVGIVGLPRGGKTTVFNAVTRGTAQTATYGSQEKPNLGVAKVPDGRLDVLEGIFGPKRKVPAEVMYADLPGAADGSGRTSAIVPEHLNHLQRVDALMVVIRAFEDPSVSHVEDTVDPFRDAETVFLEMMFSDLEIMQKRLDRLAEGSKGVKAPEREGLVREQSLLARIKAGLEAGTAVSRQSLATEEERLVRGFGFLTAKPAIVAVNAGEDQMSEADALEARLLSAFEGASVRTLVLCGKLEMELAQMEPAEEREFRESLGVGESGLHRMLKLSHDVADLITFFTCNPNEVRAWTLPRGTRALEAAGKVHSDFERGFIRAEVVKFADLAECGSVAEARKRGVLRQEGREYVVGDGDVLNILFSV